MQRAGKSREGFCGSRGVRLEDGPVGIGGRIGGQAVQGSFETSRDIVRSLLECMQDGHENFAGFGSGIGLRTEADLSSYHKRTKFTLGPIIISRHIAIIRPVI